MTLNHISTCHPGNAQLIIPRVPASAGPTGSSGPQSSIRPSLGRANCGFGVVGRTKFRLLSLPSLARLVDQVASRLP